jgi:hypothetical protein
MTFLSRLHGLGASEFECAALPSSTAAADLIAGKPGGLTAVVTSTALRAGLIAAGLAIAGERKRLLKYSVFSALAIEAFVLAYVAANRRKE